MKYKYKNKRRLIFVLLTLAVLLCAMASCTVKMTDEEARAVLDELLPKAAVINDIVWGEGLPTDTPAADGDEETDRYLPVSESSHIKSRDEFKAAVRAVYSEDILEWVDSLAFEGGEEFMSRYTEVGGKIKADRKYEKLEMKTEFLTETAHVVGATPYLVEVELTYTTDGEPGGTATLTLVRASDGSFRLNSPTY